MILLTGGAYQGKKKYARDSYALAESDFYHCSEQDGVIDFSKRAICGLHLLSLWQVKNEICSVDWVRGHREALREKILLCDDISCGVVPLDPQLREWREETGRLLLLLSSEADEVWRLFCGIPVKLK